MRHEYVGGTLHADVSDPAPAHLNTFTVTVTGMTTPGDVKPIPAQSDIGSQLDALPVGRVHRKVVVAIGLGLFFEVYEIFLSSSIATALKTEYHLGGTALQLLMASSFIGMFIGAAAFGRIADRIGRRKAFLLNLVWFSVCSLLAAVAPTPSVICCYAASNDDRRDWTWRTIPTCPWRRCAPHPGRRLHELACGGACMSGGETSSTKYRGSYGRHAAVAAGTSLGGAAATHHPA